MELPADGLTEPCPHCAGRVVFGLESSDQTVLEGPRADGLLVEPETSSRGMRRQQFGDYELVEEIAHGAMGVVCKARQLRLQRMVALKMILRGQYASSVEVNRFLTEAQAAAHLNHPNIVAIHEIGQHEGQHYFSMQLIEGRSLAQQIQAGEWPLDNGKAAARLLAKVARAVHYAHEAGILHRDLKPANILIDAQGEPHIADFGLARQLGMDSSLTLDGAVVGTPTFMAPEQAAGEAKHLTRAADIYSLGAILYYLLTGRPPFASESVLHILAQVLEREAMLPRAINPRLGRDLEQICLRCLEKSPEARYASAAELAEDLEQFLREEPVAARTRHWGLKLRHWTRQRPALISRLTALSVCAGIAQINYHLTHKVPLSFHVRVMSVLAIWAVVSALCQWAMSQQRFAPVVRFVWATTDAVLLTALLYIDSALNGPLIALYPVLIAASSFWFRVELVACSTGLSIFGYGLLLLDQAWHRGPLEQPNWHAVFLVALVLTGGITSYLVHRVRALNRFYETKSSK
jgi:eukaryotic-like serine/threonine-protein kinase